MRKRTTPAVSEVVEEVRKQVPVLTEPNPTEAEAIAREFLSEERPMSAGFERIVTKIFVDDVSNLYERLEAELRIGDDRDDRGTVQKALDNAAENSRLAYRLYTTAAIEQRSWELENAPIQGAMRARATEALQQEKAEGKRSKAITEADVEAMCATLFADEWKAQELRRERVSRMVKSIENLAEALVQRSRALNTMYDKVR